MRSKAQVPIRDTPYHNLDMKRGFTLIELLVVVAIIAILAGLLLPALARGKDSARSIVCLNNQKQLYLAWQMYGDDHEQFANNNNYGLGTPLRAPNWTAGGMTYELIIQGHSLSDATNTAILTDAKLSQLARYLKSAGVFKCPADQSYAVRPVEGGGRYARARSYSMVQTIGEPRSPYTGVHYFFKPADFSLVSPSRIFLFLDEHEDSINDGFFFLGNPGIRTWGWSDLPASRHKKAANFVFADGHAEKHRWRDKRTIQPVTRIRIAGLNQPNNPDVGWIHDHAMIPK